MYGAAVRYSDQQEFLQRAYNSPGAKVNLSFGPLDGFEHPAPVTMSNIVFNGRWFGVQRVFSQGQYYLNNFDSDVPIKVHLPTGARAFGAFFSSWIGPQFATFTGTVTTDQGDRFVVQGPTDSGSGPATYLGLLFSDSVYDLTFDDGAALVSGGYNMHEEMVADVFAVLNPVPSLAISRLPSGILNVQVDGSVGQTVVLCSSTNLTDWHSVATNKLTAPQWIYTGALPQVRSTEFLMLKLR